MLNISDKIFQCGGSEWKQLLRRKEESLDVRCCWGAKRWKQRNHAFPSFLRFWILGRLPAAACCYRCISKSIHYPREWARVTISPQLWLKIYSLLNLSSFSLLAQLKSSSKLSILTFYSVLSQAVNCSNFELWAAAWRQFHLVISS